MVASRRPWGLALATSMRRSTSASVRCSRVRKSRLGSRRGDLPSPAPEVAEYIAIKGERAKR